MNPNQIPSEDPLLKDDEENDSAADSDVKPSRRSGRRKIKIEYIEDKNRRHITFSKRKAGIMKKAYELSTLTGTQVLLLVVSETGLVYTFTTVKLQPIVTKPEGKNLIQACLNAPDPIQTDANVKMTFYFFSAYFFFLIDILPFRIMIQPLIILATGNLELTLIKNPLQSMKKRRRM
ncbi:uncharacterized protein EV154DRAFT_410975 [Mucor mucedo]|uniref:uncharacterized protein n=1 Tax=Mucor mucedo TaxID=29922 RepID=UPI00221F7A7A|nr:uncharacterized protein EV154DRAFT_410975 [Mucor mucedo]KAI7896874.1 hypothetical protein EV154DRAFT_410975 [Mucor mucedo]